MSSSSSQEMLPIVPGSRFTIAKPLFRNVFLGVDRVSKSNIALKRVWRNKKAPGVLCRGLTEYLIGKQMNHPHIVRTLDCMETDAYTLVIQEYANGGDLFERIQPRATRPSASSARTWMFEIAQALQHMHSKGFIHNDVKPENVLIHDGHVRLADFGLSTKAGAGCAGNLGGTRQYMAPETLTGTGYTVTAAQDVWSLGIVLYAILFADLPWERARPSDDNYHYYSLTRSLGTASDMLSPQLFALLCHMLEPDPTLRASLDEVLDFFGNTTIPCPFYQPLYLAKLQQQQQQQQQHSRTPSPTQQPNSASSSSSSSSSLRSPCLSPEPMFDVDDLTHMLRTKLKPIKESRCSLSSFSSSTSISSTPCSSF